jgi:hypothetical protein
MNKKEKEKKEEEEEAEKICIQFTRYTTSSLLSVLFTATDLVQSRYFSNISSNYVQDMYRLVC